MAEENFVFPRKKKLQNHAKSIKNALANIKYSQAKEMVSFLYGCRDWKQLMSCISNELDKPTKSKVLSEVKAEPFSQVARDELIDFINLNWASPLELLERLPLKPFTISYCISKKEIGWLLDTEIAHLHASVFQDPKNPNTDIFNVLEDLDNNILTKIFMMRERGKSYANSHFYDFRFGLEIYYHLRIDGNKISFIIREFDSCFYYEIGKNFSRRWFFIYINDYLTLLSDQLKASGFIPEITLEKVNNVMVSDLSQHLSKVKF